MEPTFIPIDRAGHTAGRESVYRPRLDQTVRSQSQAPGPLRSNIRTDKACQARQSAAGAGNLQRDTADGSG